MLKLYTCDLNWRGSIVVVAHSLEEATELMKGCLNFIDYSDGEMDNPVIKESAIVAGFIHYNLGDM